MAPTELLAEQHFATIAALRRAARRARRAAHRRGRTQRAASARTPAGRRRDSARRRHPRAHSGGRAACRASASASSTSSIASACCSAPLLRRLRGATDGRAPHILLMTATPIPRTLAHDDLRRSRRLDARRAAAGRKPVRTMIFNEAERATRLCSWSSRSSTAAAKAYVVYPLVEASEKEDLRDRHDDGRASSAARCSPATASASLHGRMKADEKDAVMRRFRAGDLQLLFSTTVIEVGVDVPNASVMVDRARRPLRPLAAASAARPGRARQRPTRSACWSRRISAARTSTGA